ncbi:Fumarate reductase-like flavoprotein [Desulfitobacterium hafniense]|uniref:Urocanate reductase n=1 Tax=Desulfitobacterium hafniense TaxID=49338 RepID=A0A098B3G9_DESHA|nr:FAD-binding protein [Desulfitobacterium hafniense]CDX02925.1 Fumarate reductase-like flavoprotein [Desulfitobacterium hafniense]
MKKTKVISILAVLLCLTLGLSGCTAAPAGAGNPAPEKGGIVPGDYLGVGNGRNGSIVVKVTLGADSIDAVKVVSEKETYNTGSVPIKQYPDLIVQNQTLDLDVVSGATISSAAFLNAVRNAITQAGGDPAQFAGKVAADVPHEDTTADVVVVGAGGAGMTAAISAANEGKKVILLEKLGIVGGTSNYSIESFGAIGDKTHVALGSDVTPQEQAATLAKQNPKGTAEAFSVLTGNNGAAADWLRSIGAQLTVAGGQISSTASREVGEFGNTIVSALKAECEKAGVDVRVNSKATELVMKDGVVDGVKVSTKLGDYTISAKAVVIASGGFGANKEMVAEYAPTLKDYKSSCSPGGTGDGHLMAQTAGADLKNMDYIRVNFTYTTAENGYFYYMGSLFNTGAIFVNKDGQRFVNDQGGYGVGPQVVAQGGSGWAIFDNSLVAGVKDVREYEKLGLFVSADSIEELADKIGVNKENLVKTINNYKGYVAAGKDEEFGRAMLNMTFDEAPYYAAPMTCRVQGTFGGIDTDVNTQVLKADGTPIPGLFAAGECANDGTWGANPAAVNVVFGRIAGQNAAAYVK